jgi:hypothetical protein
MDWQDVLYSAALPAGMPLSVLRRRPLHSFRRLDLSVTQALNDLSRPRHAATIEVIESAPSEIHAGATITLKVKVKCPYGCDLTGMPIEIAAPDGALARSEFAPEHGGNDVTEVKLETADRTGEHSWIVRFGPYDVADIRHDAGTVVAQTKIKPNTTSLAVWSIPSPLVTGERFAIELGAKSSRASVLAAECVEVRDKAGEVIARGRLGDTPYPGTTALYWTNVELVAPAREGLQTWSVTVEPKGLALPHERTSTTFSVLVVRPPEHRLTIKLIEKETSAPIANAQVRLGAYRAVTDPLGVAEIDVPKGDYDLNIWMAGYEAPTTNVRLDSNMLIEIRAVLAPGEDPDAAWLM